MTEIKEQETLGFQAEVRQMLHLMIHSLYSNKEIFLRELISNAADAADKLRFEALANPALLADDPALTIRVDCDAKARTISVTDNGIGMSRDEIVRNLGTIAKSGTDEFLQQMTGDARKDARLIGQFGVGFYSAFIVSDRVEVESRRAGLAADEAVHWESDGQGEFTVRRIEREARGTRVTLHLKKTETEFLERARLETLIRKYSDHIGVPVFLGKAGEDGEGTAVNTGTALWTRPRSEIEDEEYREFYKHLSHDYADPLLWSHNRVEGKREYTSLLYLPEHAPFDLWNREAPRGLKLYVQRVFIMDHAEHFLPLYLRFVKGVIDSSDLPLNVSREMLQQNAHLESIRGALTRRVLDMLAKLADKEPDKYAKFWHQFGEVLKEGVVEDPQNVDKLAKLLRFATTHGGSEGQDQSLADYVSRATPAQDRIYYTLAESVATAGASPHLERLREKGLEVMLLTDRIDPWIVEHLPEFEGKKLHDVSRGDLEIPEDEGALTQQAMSEEHKPLLKKLRRVLKERVEDVNVSVRLVDSPACVITAAHDLAPQVRRILEAAGQDLPESKPRLEINVEHPLVKKLSAAADDHRFEMLANVILDHALLAEGTPLPDPADYLRRVHELLLNPDA